MPDNETLSARQQMTNLYVWTVLFTTWGSLLHMRRKTRILQRQMQPCCRSDVPVQLKGCIILLSIHTLEVRSPDEKLKSEPEQQALCSNQQGQRLTAHIQPANMHDVNGDLQAKGNVCADKHCHCMSSADSVVAESDHMKQLRTCHKHVWSVQ